MGKLRFAVVTMAALALAAGGLGEKAGAEDWQKTYPIGGKASVQLHVGDAQVDVRGCGACKAVKIAVDWRDSNPSDFSLRESQAGDMVDFELGEKVKWGIHFNASHAPHVTVETPETLQLQMRTSDGAIKVSGVQGDIRLHTSDGGVDVEDVGGSLELEASDGKIRIHNVSGRLDSKSSDGPMTIDGKFTGLHVHTSDGNVELTALPGSQLATPSRIESSDGKVALRLPRDLAADLDVHTSDGKISCDLAVKMDGYTSSGSGHTLRGHLNGGGQPLQIHTSDGNVTITALSSKPH